MLLGRFISFFQKGRKNVILFRWITLEDDWAAETESQQYLLNLVSLLPHDVAKCRDLVRPKVCCIMGLKHSALRPRVSCLSLTLSRVGAVFFDGRIQGDSVS